MIFAEPRCQNSQPSLPVPRHASAKPSPLPCQYAYLLPIRPYKATANKPCPPFFLLIYCRCATLLRLRVLCSSAGVGGPHLLGTLPISTCIQINRSALLFALVASTGSIRTSKGKDRREDQCGVCGGEARSVGQVLGGGGTHVTGMYRD